MVYENGVSVDSQYEDGDPELMYSERYIKLLQVSRSAIGFAKRAVEAPRRLVETPKRIHNRALHIIDQFDRATGRM